MAFVLIGAVDRSAHADCAATVNSAVDRMMDLEMQEGIQKEGDKMTPEMRKMAMDMANEMKPKMKAAMTKSCIDDAWTTEALTCMDAAVTMEAMERCEYKLSSQQRSNLDRAMGAALGMTGDESTAHKCTASATKAAEYILGLRTIPGSPAPTKAQLDRRRAAAASLQVELNGFCASDRWPDETISCMKSAATLGDVAVCQGRLPADAIEHVQKAEMDALGRSVECVKTTSAAVDRMIKAQLKSMPEDDGTTQMRARLAWALAESCSADWWSASSVACVGRAKTAKAMEACEARLTPLQRADVDAVVNSATGMSGAAASTSLPPECEAYHAAIERLGTCDKMPVEARDALLQAWKEASAGWTNLPPAALANLATACKAGTDAVNQSAKAVCGW